MHVRIPSIFRNMFHPRMWLHQINIEWISCRMFNDFVPQHVWAVSTVKNRERRTSAPAPQLKNILEFLSASVLFSLWYISTRATTKWQTSRSFRMRFIPRWMDSWSKDHQQHHREHQQFLNASFKAFQIVEDPYCLVKQHIGTGSMFRRQRAHKNCNLNHRWQVMRRVYHLSSASWFGPCNTGQCLRSILDRSWRRRPEWASVFARNEYAVNRSILWCMYEFPVASDYRSKHTCQWLKKEFEALKARYWVRNSKWIFGYVYFEITSIGHDTFIHNLSLILIQHFNMPYNYAPRWSHCLRISVPYLLTDLWTQISTMYALTLNRTEHTTLLSIKHFLQCH